MKIIATATNTNLRAVYLLSETQLVDAFAKALSDRVELMPNNLIKLIGDSESAAFSPFNEHDRMIYLAKQLDIRLAMTCHLAEPCWEAGYRDGLSCASTMQIAVMYAAVTMKFGNEIEITDV